MKKAKQLTHPKQTPSKRRRSRRSLFAEQLANSKRNVLPKSTEQENKAFTRRFHQPIQRSQTKITPGATLPHPQKQWRRHSQNH